MGRRLTWYACAALLVSGMCLAEPASTRSARGEPEPSKFIRFVPDQSGGGELQVSIVSYRNAEGVTVDLIGAVHIADPAYFSGLNQRFDSYDSVLFEMVRPRGMTRMPSTREANADAGAQPPPRGGRSLGLVRTLQQFLREQLDLEFQLEGIDYDKPNFVHADLDVETFLEMQEQRGESMMKLMLQAMLRELGRGPRSGAAQPNVFELLAALRAPDRARQLKLVLAKQFTQMEDLLGSWDGPKGSVILTERNKAAMKVLRDQIAKGDRKLGVFYGAGHLKGMERILTEEMGFRQAGEPQWLTAWDVTTAEQPATAPAVKP